MAIVNRDKDGSEQREVVSVAYRAVGVSTVLPVIVAPYPCTIEKVMPCVLGVSGSPIFTFQRLSIGSSGLAIGISGLVGTAFGTSGAIAFSGLAAAGSTLLDLAEGDMVQVISSGANSAVDLIKLDVVIQKTQDIVSYF